MIYDDHEGFEMEKHPGNELKIKNSIRVEFIVERQTIEQRLNCGHTPKDIWRALRETGRVTMSYESFLRFTRKYLPGVGGSTKQVAAVSSPTSNAGAGAGVGAGAGGKGQIPPKQREPIMNWPEEKPRREINLCTIGKEYLIERHVESNSDKESQKRS